MSVGPRYAPSNCLVKISNFVVLHYFYVAAKKTILTGSSTNWVKYACYPLGDIKTCLRMSELPIYRQIPHKTSPINQLIWTGQAITTVTNSRQIDSPKTITLSHSSHSQAICLETGLWYRARQLAFSIHLMSESSFQVGFYRTFVFLFSEPSSNTTPDVTVRGTGDAGEFIHSVITDYDY